MLPNECERLGEVGTKYMYKLDEIAFGVPTCLYSTHMYHRRPADIWALGATLVELWINEKPMKRMSDEDVEVRSTEGAQCVIRVKGAWRCR